ncbi:MAG TPA: hypothetical protein VH301_14750, partial [Usitatibacter sp.]|nr:hypothetical protein [Usitatibacter sp.]
MRDEAMVDVTLLTAAQALAMLADGRMTAEQLVSGCLARIRGDEDRVQAWAFIDEAHALEQAKAADARRREGRPLGPLH